MSIYKIVRVAELAMALLLLSACTLTIPNPSPEVDPAGTPEQTSTLAPAEEVPNATRSHEGGGDAESADSEHLVLATEVPPDETSSLIPYEFLARLNYNFDRTVPYGLIVAEAALGNKVGRLKPEGSEHFSSIRQDILAMQVPDDPLAVDAHAALYNYVNTLYQSLTNPSSGPFPYLENSRRMNQYLAEYVDAMREIERFLGLTNGYFCDRGLYVEELNQWYEEVGWNEIVCDAD